MAPWLMRTGLVIHYSITSEVSDHGPVPKSRIRHRQFDSLCRQLNAANVRRQLTQQIKRRERRPRPLFDRKPRHVAGAM